jgi:hypothetical protein
MISKQSCRPFLAPLNQPLVLHPMIIAHLVFTRLRLTTSPWLLFKPADVFLLRAHPMDLLEPPLVPSILRPMLTGLARYQITHTGHPPPPSPLMAMVTTITDASTTLIAATALHMPIPTIPPLMSAIQLAVLPLIQFMMLTFQPQLRMIIVLLIQFIVVPWLPFRYLPALMLQLQLVTATKILLTPSWALMHLSTLAF